MKRTLPFVYVPNIAELLCPYPLQPLALWCAAQWLQSGYTAILFQQQRDCRDKPEPSNESSAHLDEPRIQHVASESGKWRLHPKDGLIPPPTVFMVAARAQTALEMSARKALDDALVATFTKRGILHSLGRKYEPFAVWHGLVQGRPVNEDEPRLDRAHAERDCVNLVVEDGEEAAGAIAQAIVNAIEINFKEAGQS